jgi:serine/threonine protein kinase
MPKQPPLQPPQPAQPLPPGYRIISWIGEGQFGKVYRVRTPGGMRDAALKIVQLTRGASEGLKEFRSLDVIRGIKPHRNLLQYQGVWLRTQDGRFLDNADELDGADLEGSDLLIVMELADKTLADRLNECRAQIASDRPSGIPINELLISIRQSARGLDHLHAEIHDLNGKLARVIHRDVKPANLLLFAGEIKVADYGVARAEVRDMKATQSISYTPAYAPPELYSNLPVPASDQYSLAISYYELRTGCLPFSGFATPAHLLGALEFDLVPAKEQEVLRRATTLVVSQRYPSCMSFADDLRAAVEWEASIGAEMPDRRIAPVEPPPSTDPARITFHAAGSGTSRFKVPPELLVKRNEEPREDTPDEALEDSHDTPTEPPAKSGGADSPSGNSNTLVFTHLPQDQDSHLDGGPERPAEPSSRSGRLPHPMLRPQLSEVPAPGLTPVGPESSDLVKGFFAPTRSVDVPETAGNDEFRSTMVPTGVQPHHHDPKDVDPPYASEIPDYHHPRDVGSFSNVIPPEEIQPPPWRQTPPPQKRHKAFKFLLLAVAIVIGMGIIAGARKLFEPKAVEEPPPVGTEINKPTPTPTPTPPSTHEPEGPADPHVRSVPHIPETAPHPRLKPDPISPPPPPVDFADKLKIGRNTLNAGNLVNGLSLLDEILGHDPPPPKKVQREAEALRTAWKDAQKHNRNAATVTVEEVVQAGKCSIGDWAAMIENRDLLTEEDKKALNAFYQRRFEGLIERFVRDPDPRIDWSQPKSWKDLKFKLDEVQTPSPWLDLLRIECRLMENYLSGEGAISEKLPKRDSGMEPEELKAYRAFVTAGFNWASSTVAERSQAREAADQIVKTVGDDKVKALLNPARKQLVCRQLLEADEYALRPVEKAEIDRPYGADQEAPKLAKKWLETATNVLANDNNSAFAKKVRGRLLIAEAFLAGGPGLTRDRDPLRSDSPEEVAKALDSRDRFAFWLAYARTRDRTSQTSERLKGYEKAVEMALATPAKLDIPLVSRLAKEVDDKELFGALAIAPDDTKRKMSTLCASLARPLFRHKPLTYSKSDPLVTVLAKLGERTASLSDDPDLQALAGIIALECGDPRKSEGPEAAGSEPAQTGKTEKDKVKSSALLKRQQTAAALVARSGLHVAPLVYLGKVLIQLADSESDIQAQLDLFRQSADAFSKAAQAANQPDDKAALLPLLHYNAAIVNLRIANYIIDRGPREVRSQLEIALAESRMLDGLVNDDPHALYVKGCILEDQAWLPAGYTESQRRQFYRSAVRALSNATKDKAESGVIRFEALMHLGRCQYKWANQFPDPDPDDLRETKQQLLANAMASLDEVVQRKDQREQQPESLYWLAMIELTKAGLAWLPTATRSFPDDLFQVVKLDDASLNKARDHLIELQKLSKSANSLNKSWYERDGADWLACLMCYQARTANKDGKGLAMHREALDALDRLAQSDPVTAALRRTQYLYGQLETSADQSAKVTDMKILWSDFEKSRRDTTLSATRSGEERKLLILYLLRYRATAIQIKQQLPVGGNPEKPFDRVLELIKRNRMEKADIAIQLEDTATHLASRAVYAGADKATIAALAARAFLTAEELDKSIGYLSKFPWKLTAAQWREHTADLIKSDSPDDADKLYSQAETILALITDEKEKTIREEFKQRLTLKRTSLNKSK